MFSDVVHSSSFSGTLLSSSVKTGRDVDEDEAHNDNVGGKKNKRFLFITAET